MKKVGFLIRVAICLVFCTQWHTDLVQAQRNISFHESNNCINYAISIADFEIGTAYQSADNINLALNYFSKVDSLSAQDDLVSLWLVANFNLSDCEVLIAKYPASINSVRKLLPILYQIKDNTLIGKAYFYMARSYTALGDSSGVFENLDSVTKYEDFLKKDSVKYNEYQILLGVVNTKSAHYNEAIVNFTYSLNWYTNRKETANATKIQNSIGNMYLYQEKWVEAYLKFVLARAGISQLNQSDAAVIYENFAGLFYDMSNAPIKDFQKLEAVMGQKQFWVDSAQLYAKAALEPLLKAKEWQSCVEALEILKWSYEIQNNTSQGLAISILLNDIKDSLSQQYLKEKQPLYQVENDKGQMDEAHLASTEKQKIEFQAAQEKAQFMKKIYLTFGITILLGTIIYLVLYFKQKVKKREALVRQSIADDLHDNIGSILTGISIVADYMQHTNQDDEGIKSQLEKISSNGRDAIQNLKESIWAIKPEHNSLHFLIEKLKRYTNDYLEPIGIDVNVLNHVANPSVTLPINVVQGFSFFFRDYVYKIVTIEQLTNFEIAFSMMKNILIIDITENGDQVGKYINELLATDTNELYKKLKSMKADCTVNIKTEHYYSFRVNIQL